MSNPEPNIYVYKMVVDNGGAPCVTGGKLLSLSICKPKIRKSAEKDALVFGFGGKRYHERLIYIACVTDKLEGPSYYQQTQYARRADCIYRVDEKGNAVRKTSARYHVDSDERRKDVGSRFENAFVLLSKDFRYLGNKGTDDYKDKECYSEIRTLIKKLTQGHRRHHSTKLRAELLALKAEIWSKYPRKKVVGKPTDKDFTRLCNNGSPSANC